MKIDNGKILRAVFFVIAIVLVWVLATNTSYAHPRCSEWMTAAQCDMWITNGRLHDEDGFHVGYVFGEPPHYGPVRRYQPPPPVYPPPYGHGYFRYNAPGIHIYGDRGGIGYRSYGNSSSYFDLYYRHQHGSKKVKKHKHKKHHKGE